MKIETLDLHGLNAAEAREKTNKNIRWAIGHGVEVLVINHGKGHHSSGFAVLKSEIRKMLREDPFIRENGYRVVYGESDQPVALTYNEGNTLVVARGMESQFIGGKAQQDRNQRIFSDDSRRQRKAGKRRRGGR
ncbi:MAG: Smr/MutS family protein [Syntrophomonadaceae bacterium]|nr:Smr/MutS family protein [Syntrophomonadaceae bacterium]